ncbi:glycosyltransferase family 2 protein [Croceicoccus gelatinilyticus]|uniref:glycosyltransferase family 2 protein n=1 Tax=Croceicoccus gelatinilyticus TaxID=2835536 RepID=UPI001BCF2A3E|nr:glycosyltransferase family 2 protein [Croceicoccus gelatinilyticus]MBS7670674.1 glycosyltransferase [Croceicoccus gelatinilyticus]
MRIHVAIATTGRAPVLRKNIERLNDQTRKADGIVIVGHDESDVEGVAGMPGDPLVLLAPKGACSQRNAALEQLDGKTDVIVFFDDDFVAAPDYLANVEHIFESEPDVVGLTGHLVDDGAKTGAIDFEDAVWRLDTLGERARLRSKPAQALYGCNMVFRSAAAEGLRFDENLPLYGWQEDIDFTTRVGRNGKLVRSRALTGIHLGSPAGRTSGLRLGYSQVANIFYLRSKGTIGRNHGWGLLFKNLLANIVKSVPPPNKIDRRGRLRGNMVAFRDLLLRRLHPRRITEL